MLQFLPPSQSSVHQYNYKLLHACGCQCPSPFLFRWLFPLDRDHMLYWLLGILVRILREKIF
jgi:hypothetical protein